MTKEELFAIQQKTHKRCSQIMRDKNHDYAGDGDALRNFKVAEYLGVCRAATTVMIEITKKVARLANIYLGGAKNESVDDTLDDIINYCDILRAVLKEKK